MKPLLTICVCSIPCRAEFLSRLMANLVPQIAPSVQLMLDLDAGDVSIGTKRNRMLAAAQGEYICFVDDDDTVADDYVARILEALESRPDCVGFKLDRMLNGFPTGWAIHSLGIPGYSNHLMPNGQTMYLRTPNHLNPVRIEIARQVGFPEIDWGEDGDYAKRLRPLLKSEVLIKDVMYHYLFRHECTRGNEVTHKSRINGHSHKVPVA